MMDFSRTDAFMSGRAGGTGDERDEIRGSISLLPAARTMDIEEEDEEEGGSPTATKKYPDYCRTLRIKDANGTVKELVFPKALDLDRPKRARTTFSAEQLYKLETEFQRNQYLVGRERTDLARGLQLTETQVKVWFQNRRTKYKRDSSRQAEERQQQAEGVATCNILRILQHTPPTPATPPSTTGPAPNPPPPPQAPPTTTSTPPIQPRSRLPISTPTLPPVPISISISNTLPSPLHTSIPAARYHIPGPAHLRANLGMIPSHHHHHHHPHPVAYPPGFYMS